MAKIAGWWTSTTVPKRPVRTVCMNSEYRSTVMLPSRRMKRGATTEKRRLPVGTSVKMSETMTGAMPRSTATPGKKGESIAKLSTLEKVAKKATRMYTISRCSEDGATEEATCFGRTESRGRAGASAEGLLESRPDVSVATGLLWQAPIVVGCGSVWVV